MSDPADCPKCGDWRDGKFADCAACGYVNPGCPDPLCILVDPNHRGLHHVATAAIAERANRALDARLRGAGS